ncbi:ATP-binding protein [Actinoplanes sp. CA-054009]
MLRGRDRERAALAELLDGAREGRSAALALRGEAGVGKTALLDDLVAAATGFRIVRGSGSEAERELPYAGLHQLCAPLSGHLDRLPGPQRDALATTLGLHAGPAPAPLLVSLAVLGLLAEAAAGQPLLCVVDDAQWLDQASAQALGFTARRLATESVLIVFAVRAATGEQTPATAGLPELTVDRLGDADARALLASVVRWPLADDVREALLAEAQGNPLALLELPAAGAPLGLAGGFALPDARPVPSRVEASFRRRLGALSPGARSLLLLAAADPVGDTALLWRAAGLLGLSRDQGEELQSAGLLRLGVRVVLRHPLVRSAVYRAATLFERQAVHAALAEATDAAADPDRRAWHRAQAVAGPDDDVAAELEASAHRALARGGVAAAAAFLHQAAELTRDPARQADRELAAARATYKAGSREAAARLLRRAADGPGDELRDARVDLLRGQMAFASADSAHAPGLLLQAASRFGRLDPARAREIYLEAFAAATLVARFAGDADLPGIAAAARRVPPAHEPGALNAFLDALAALYADGFAAGAPAVRAALAKLDVDDLTVTEAIHWPHTVCNAANAVFDDHAWSSITSAYLRTARRTGELAGLSYILNQRIGLHLHQGEVAHAAELAEEAAVVAAAVGRSAPVHAALVVAAWRGDEGALRLGEASIAAATRRSEGAILTVALLSMAVLHNGRSRFAEAFAAAERATAYPVETGFANWALGELIEAAARTGRPAGAALERLTERATASGSDWALGVLARSRALLAGGAEAEPLYREAIDRLGRSRGAFPLARTHLLYGEWLRAQARNAEAREQLRTAYEMFRSFGADAFGRRARSALAACGAFVTPETAGPAVTDLTPQELQIARRARDGQSNHEIAADLFLSARTVEWHLSKVFVKLGIANRRQLPVALPAAAR